MLGKPVEKDPRSGAEIYRIGADPRPADNIYGEQPYSDPTGRWVAVRYYESDGQPGGIAVVDLSDGSRREVRFGKPLSGAFHAWGEHLYWHEETAGGRQLLRCRYDSPGAEAVAFLPAERGRYSYGTVSQDGRHYAVSVTGQGGASDVHLLDLGSGQWCLLFEMPGFHFKHEQFSLDGRNRVLIQMNQQPDRKQVLLAELDLEGPARMFPADRPHTPQPGGHEAWVGNTAAVLFNTWRDPATQCTVWIAKADEAAAQPVCTGDQRFCHVSVSRCGRYWIADAPLEDGVPIYAGRFGSGRCRRVLFSRTVYDGSQWSHTHPYFTADNRWLVFTSSRMGRPQVYAAKLEDGWLGGL